jgi:hypothetical protein
MGRGGGTIRARVRDAKGKSPPRNPFLDGSGYGVGAGIGQAIVTADRVSGCRLRLFREWMAKRGYMRVPKT